MHTTRRLSAVLVLLASAVLVASVSAAQRVVGGSAATIQSAPWTVFIQNRGSIEYDECTGSIVDPQHVLTAAHCVFDTAGNLAKPAQFSVRAGISNVASPASTDAEQDRTVSSFTIHPGYVNSGTPGPDDVALLALGTPLDLSGGAVKAVALPPSQPGSYPAGAAVGFAGFGEQSSGANPNGQLYSLTGTVDEQGLCGDGYGVSAMAIRFCMSSPTSATCHGDSGGGLVTTGSTPVLIGVLSAGPNACGTGTHSIYTYVAAPEILLYIHGNQQPPTAPRESQSTEVGLRWNPSPTVGATLGCYTDSWGGQPTFTYAFVNTATGKTLKSGPTPSYVLQPADANATIACTAYATNAGGTASLTTDPTPPIAAAAGAGASTSKSKPAPTPSGGTTSGGTTSGGTTARKYNAQTITDKASRIPPLPSRPGASVAVPEWNGYLLLALIASKQYGGAHYRSTYVRCWSKAGWTGTAPAGDARFEAGGALLAYSEKGSAWIDVPSATCSSARDAAQGRLTATSAVALATVLHETFVREGVRDGTTATCLGTTGLWQAVDRRSGATAANRAVGLVARWYEAHLDHAALSGFDACVRSVEASPSA